ncbi:uncharacterized protein LOC122787437 [Protopterus annectens]|uniref:uncharacterized protein LOC122787437 n=1 Tax=Protopterus annectens TaxID=7888 RepID=UPI001CFA5B61|nr:uncharacterized protein LOC122787437 [Protopterus annectens]
MHRMMHDSLPSNRDLIESIEVQKGCNVVQSPTCGSMSLMQLFRPDTTELSFVSQEDNTVTSTVPPLQNNAAIQVVLPVPGNTAHHGLPQIPNNAVIQEIAVVLENTVGPGTSAIQDNADSVGVPLMLTDIATEVTLKQDNAVLGRVSVKHSSVSREIPIHEIIVPGHTSECNSPVKMQTLDHFISEPLKTEEKQNIGVYEKDESNSANALSLDNMFLKQISALESEVLGQAVTQEHFPVPTSCIRSWMLGKRHHSVYQGLGGWQVDGTRKSGTDYSCLVKQNTELLNAVKELEKQCVSLKDENCLLVRSYI